MDITTCAGESQWASQHVRPGCGLGPGKYRGHAPVMRCRSLLLGCKQSTPRCRAVKRWVVAGGEDPPRFHYFWVLNHRQV